MEPIAANGRGKRGSSKSAERISGERERPEKDFITLTSIAQPPPEHIDN
jgi:hypothetical protein